MALKLNLLRSVAVPRPSLHHVVRMSCNEFIVRFGRWRRDRASSCVESAWRWNLRCAMSTAQLHPVAGGPSSLCQVRRSVPQKWVYSPMLHLAFWAWTIYHNSHGSFFRLCIRINSNKWFLMSSTSRVCVLSVSSFLSLACLCICLQCVYMLLPIGVINK